MTASGGPSVEQRRTLVTEIPGPRSVALHAERTRHVSDSLGTVMPVFIERAGGGILVDVDGNHIIDMASGIAVTSVGNSAPAVVNAVTAQVSAFTHTCFMVTEYSAYVDVCERLNALTPGDHDKRSALFNSGAEAVENAVKIARAHTSRNDVVVVEHAYHGRTNLTMGMTAKNMPYKHSFGPFASGIHRVPTSYPIRDGRAGPAAAAHAISKITTEVGAENVAAIVIEPIQGEGGFIVPADGFLPALREFAREQGIVFVADEIQTGFGRTGEWFACDHEGIVPDLITTAKAMGGGLPIAGVTGTAEIMNAVHVGGLGGTYGGNPVACAAALGAIATIEDDKLLDRARAIEQQMRPLLIQCADETGVIADVRGRGAMIAVELVKPGTMEPDPALTKDIVGRCHREGVLVLSAGSYSNVLRFLPPLVISDELLADALEIITKSIREAAAQ